MSVTLITVTAYAKNNVTGSILHCNFGCIFRNYFGRHLSRRMLLSLIAAATWARVLGKTARVLDVGPWFSHSRLIDPTEAESRRMVGCYASTLGRSHVGIRGISISQALICDGRTPGWKAGMKCELFLSTLCQADVQTN